MQRNYVNAGGLFCFSSQVSQGFIDDILASNLAFQLTASSDHDKFSAGNDWRQRYLAAMSRFGYGVRGVDQQSIPAVGHESVWELIQRVLEKHVSSALLEQGHHSLIRLHDDQGEALKLFRAYTTSPLTNTQGGHLAHVAEQALDQAVVERRSAVALQMAFIDAEPRMTQIFLSFQTTSPASLLPFAQLIDQASVAGNFEMIRLTSELDDRSYARLREGLLTKLGQRRAELIMALDEDVR